jgi:hypothetical protein
MGAEGVRHSACLLWRSLQMFRRVNGGSRDPTYVHSEAMDVYWLVVPRDPECAWRSTRVRFVPVHSWPLDTVILVGLDSNDCIRTTTRQDFAK